MTENDNWVLINLDSDETLKLRSGLYSAYARSRTDLFQDEIKRQVDLCLAAHSLSGKGIHRFFSDFDAETTAAPLVLVPATAHYSMQKVIEALGLGKQQIKMIPVDCHFRTDVDALREILQRCVDERWPALVSVLGSTEEGAFDQIHRLVGLQAEMRKQGLAFYHHCDAAWGGYIRTLFFHENGNPVDTPSAIREITQTWPPDEVCESFRAIHLADSIGGKTRCLLEYVVQKMTTVPIQVMCSRNTTPWSFGRILAEEIGLEPRGNRNLHTLELELSRKLMRSPRPIFVDQANYLDERSLGTLCFLWEKRHIPIVLVGTKTLFENFYQSKLTEDVRGQLTSRIALHYLLPELTKVETEAILRHAIGEEFTDEMVEQIHQVTGGNFRSVDMIIPRILELERRNRQKLAEGVVKMNEIIKVAAARLMI